MGLTKIDGFTGEAEILGGLYRVEYAAGTLSVSGLGLDGAYAVLDALAARQIVAVRVRPGDRPLAAPQPQTPPERPSAREAPPSARAEASAAAPPWEENKPADKPAQESGAATASSGAEAAEPGPAAGAGTPPPAAAGPGGVVPEKVAGSKRFIEVLEWVMSAKGLKPADVDAIVAALEAVRDSVPVVARVRDLRDKVTSNLAAWAENGG